MWFYSKNCRNEIASAPEEKVELKTKEIIDWQYKGFGKELPEWISATFDGSVYSEVNKIFPELQNNKPVVFSCAAENLDQAEALFSNCLQKIAEANDMEGQSEKITDKFDSNLLLGSEQYKSDNVDVAFNLGGDIYLVKDHSWILLKEYFYDDEGNLEREELSYRTYAILVREDSGL